MKNQIEEVNNVYMTMRGWRHDYHNHMQLEVAGILLTMCESRTTLCKVLTEEVTESFQGKIKVFDTRIPATVKVGESIYYNMPIAQYSKKASAGIAYRKFAKEIIAYEG